MKEFWNKNRIKKGIGILLCLVAIIYGASHIHIQSVGQYKQAQKQTAEKLGLSDQSETNAESKKAVDIQEEGHTHKAASTKSAQAAEKTKSDQKKKSKDITKEKKKSAASDENKQKNSKKNHSHQGTSDSNTNGNTNGNTTDDASDGDANSSSNANASATATTKPSENQVTPSATDTSGANDTSQNTATPSNTNDKAQIQVSIEICCNKLTAIRSTLSDSIKKYVPTDGCILKKMTVRVDEGSSVYNVLQQVCKAKGIALDAEYSPGYHCYYVRGIGYIYEQQAGDMSGWVYKVNGKSPNKGASLWKVSAEDEITWSYTCDGKTS